MPNGVGFKVTGLTAVVRGLKALGLDVDDLKGAFSKIAEQGAQVERGFVPVRSGRLRSTVRGNRAQSKAVVTAGTARVRYAGPIAYGWPKRHIKPSHFPQKTDAVMRPKALALLEREINSKIREKGLA